MVIFDILVSLTCFIHKFSSWDVQISKTAGNRRQIWCRK